MGLCVLVGLCVFVGLCVLMGLSVFVGLCVLVGLFVSEGWLYSVFCLSDGRLYAGTVADQSGRDSLIYSHPLRTEAHDSQLLNGRYHVIHLPIDSPPLKARVH